MSIYELLDVRSKSIEVVNQLFRSWVTATFAVIAVGYVAGPELGWVTSMAVAMIYAVLSAGYTVGAREFQKVATGAENDLAASIGSSQDPLEVVRASVSAKGRQFEIIVFLIQFFGSIGAVAYLFYRVSGGS